MAKLTRQRIYEILSIAEPGDRASQVYDIFMIVVVVASLVSLAFINQQTLWVPIVEFCAAVIFIIDYILRWATADFKLQKGKKSFLIYPITPMAICDFLSIIPGIISVGNGLQVLRIIRFLRLFKLFSLARQTHGATEFIDVIRRERKPLTYVGVFVLMWILIVGLLLYCVEPETFENSFLNAMYWSAVSVTTIGYGDISPITALGRLLNIASALISVVIIALPASIITASYMKNYVENREPETDSPEQPGEPAIPAKAEGTKFCTQCGTPCDEDDQFCRKCGTRLK